MTELEWMKRPLPLDAPRDFRIDEMFFSTTDRKGVIVSGNDVFVRVSGYARDQLVGQPHNIIRHPEMPRAVFRLVWDFLLSGRPVTGLIKNLASDGRHYWVVALLMPIKRGGFLSVRFKPSSGLLATVEQLYRQMRAREEEVAAGADGKAAMQAAETLMLAVLRQRGFSDYESFMRTLLHDEIKSRDASLAQQRLRLFPDELAGDPADERGAALRSIHASCRRAYGEINTLYAQLDEFALLNDRLAEKSNFVLGLTQDFRFTAFNAALRAARLGEEGRSLSVIAEYLSNWSDHTSAAVGGLSRQIADISSKLRDTIFNLAAARLQIEMIMSFCGELAAGAEMAAGEGAAELRQRMIEDLQRAFAETVERAVGTLMQLADDLGKLDANSEEMRRMMLTLQVAQVGGMVEACRLKEDDSFTVLFTDLRQSVEQTKEALRDLDEASARLGVLAEQVPKIAGVISHAVEEMTAIDAGARQEAPVAV